MSIWLRMILPDITPLLHMEVRDMEIHVKKRPANQLFSILSVYNLGNMKLATNC